MKHIVIDDIIPKKLQHKYELDAKDFKWTYQKSTYEEKLGTLSTDVMYDTGQLVYPIYSFMTNQSRTGGFDLPIQIAESFPNGDYMTELEPLLEELKKHIPPFKRLRRIKFNLLWRVKEAAGRWNIPHIDTDDRVNAFNNKWSAVYYVNNADGDTCLFYPEGIERVSPKRGRVLIFPANISHASSNPVVSQDRIVINFVMETENELPNV